MNGIHWFVINALAPSNVIKPRIRCLVINIARNGQIQWKHVMIPNSNKNPPFGGFLLELNIGTCFSGVAPFFTEQAA